MEGKNKMKTINPKKIELSTALMRSRKGYAIQMGTILVLVLVAVGAYAASQAGWFGGVKKSLSVSGTGANVPAGAIQTVSNCPDTQITTFAGDQLNSLATSASYLAGTTYLIPKDNAGNLDYANRVAYTTTNTSTRATAVSLQCGKAYVWEGVATKDSHGSFDAIDLGVVQGSSTAKQAHTQAESGIKANAYDNTNRAFVYDTVDAINNDFDNLGVTFESTTNNATATAMGLGSQIDWTFNIESQTAETQFGDVRSIVCVDADKTQYTEPAISFRGTDLTDIKSTLVSDDQAVLSGYEYCYALPKAVSDTPKELRMVLTAKSGVNPSADVVLRIMGEALYVGQDGLTIKKSIFKDSDSSELYETTAQTMTVDIS